MIKIATLVSFIFGLTAGAAVIGFWQLNRSSDALDEMSVTFDRKMYFDYEDMVVVSGTLTGNGLAYPNNTHSIACFKKISECWMTYIQAIGPMHMGRLDAPSSIPIRRWSEGEIVASSEGGNDCARTTITIARKSHDVVWVEEPINQTKTYCQRSDTTIRKFTIEDSPAWKRLNSSALRP